MIAFKIIFIAIALIVTNVHHGSADHGHCLSVIGADSLFKLGPENKVFNFKKAYKQLTAEIIENKFNIEQGDTVDIMNKKYLERNLVIGYFEDFLSVKKLSFIEVDFPKTWCGDKIYLDAQSEKISPDDVESFEELCAEYTVGYLLGNEQDLSKERVFELLYTNWTEQKLLNAIDAERKNLSLDIQTPSYIEDYSLAYYRHMETYVNDDRHRESKFKSVDWYCVNEYHKIVLRCRNHY